MRDLISMLITVLAELKAGEREQCWMNAALSLSQDTTGIKTDVYFQVMYLHT